MPKKRKNELAYLGIRTRKGNRGNSGLDDEERRTGISLDNVKSQLLEIEALYSSTMKDQNREWEVPAVRE